MGKDYSKYYTPANISLALVNLIKFKNNSKVIDICCGSGNLLAAAKHMNNTLQCYGVDIDDSITKKNINISNCDGRNYAINHVGEYDYSLANPPFGKNTSTDYTDILFAEKYNAINSSRIEVEMLIANLLVLKETGVLLIIIPSTIVNGKSTINIRKTLARNHFISAIIDLPLNSFAPEKIKCSALIIEKQARIHPTTLYKMNDNYEISKIRTLCFEDISNGKWSENTTAICKDFSIKQGMISSQYFESFGEEVLHTSKCCKDWTPSIKNANLKKDKKYIMAENGDIIISRIGSSAGQMCIYGGHSRYISDCLFVIKNPEKEVAKRILDLDLKPIIGGLSTPHITANNIYNLYNKTYKKKSE